MRISPFARSYLRKRSTQLMVDTCTVFSPQVVPTLDPASQQASRPTNHVIYSGACRVWQEPAGGQVLMGDQLITQTNTSVSVPWDAPTARMNDLVLITMSDDTTILNKTLKIIAITRSGGLRGSRVYLCQALESSQAVAW